MSKDKGIAVYLYVLAGRANLQVARIRNIGFSCWVVLKLL